MTTKHPIQHWSKLMATAMATRVDCVGVVEICWGASQQRPLSSDQTVIAVGQWSSVAGMPTIPLQRKSTTSQAAGASRCGVAKREQWCLDGPSFWKVFEKFLKRVPPVGVSRRGVAKGEQWCLDGPSFSPSLILPSTPSNTGHQLIKPRLKAGHQLIKSAGLL